MQRPVHGQGQPLVEAGLRRRTTRSANCNCSRLCRSSAVSRRGFRNGRNQALRIPRDLEFPGSEVILHKEDDRLIVEPVARPRTLAEILPGLTPLTEDFPEFTDSPA